MPEGESLNAAQSDEAKKAAASGIIKKEKNPMVGMLLKEAFYLKDIQKEGSRAER